MFKRLFKVFSADSRGPEAPPIDQARPFSEPILRSGENPIEAIRLAKTSIGNVRTQLQRSAQHVLRGLELTQKAAAQGEDRRKAVEQLQQAMDAINDSVQLLTDLKVSFQAIQHKTRVINDIVFKTRLLSFNASIEAARAGQFGKGFSVVAEEVGRLAQTSGLAAKEIEALLSDSQSKAASVVALVTARATEGVAATRMVKESFTAIGQSIADLSQAFNRLDETSTDQSSGIEQTAKAIDKINPSQHQELYPQIAALPQIKKSTTFSTSRDAEATLEGIDADHPSFLAQR